MSKSTEQHGFDPQVQAYVDDELASDDRAEFQKLIAGDRDRTVEIEDLVSMKHAIREAYPVAASNKAIPAGHKRTGQRLALAASLFIGLVAGFVLSGAAPESNTPRALVSSASAQGMTRVLLHVGTRDPAAMAEALASARYILNDFKESNTAVRVQVVANGPGLDIFRSTVTPVAEQVRELELAYSNIQFVACQNTIDRVEKTQKKPVTLLPEVLRVDSGVADIARKRARGWLYIGV